uniref:Myb-like domain-containing protein n=1 Tax=Ditylenchus dipsaci TaxID=166011 RepID=A0A915E7B8_9BILA
MKVKINKQPTYDFGAANRRAMEMAAEDREEQEAIDRDFAATLQEEVDQHVQQTENQIQRLIAEVDEDARKAFEKGLAAEINAGGMRGQTKTLFKYMSMMYANLRKKGVDEFSEENWIELVKILHDDADAQIAANDPKVPHTTKVHWRGKKVAYLKKQMKSQFEAHYPYQMKRVKRGLWVPYEKVVSKVVDVEELDKESVERRPLRIPRFKQMNASGQEVANTTRKPKAAGNTDTGSLLQSVKKWTETEAKIVEKILKMFKQGFKVSREAADVADKKVIGTHAHLKEVYEDFEDLFLSADPNCEPVWGPPAEIAYLFQTNATGSVTASETPSGTPSIPGLGDSLDPKQPQILGSVVDETPEGMMRQGDEEGKQQEGVIHPGRWWDQEDDVSSGPSIIEEVNIDADALNTDGNEVDSLGNNGNEAQVLAEGDVAMEETEGKNVTLEVVVHQATPTFPAVVILPEAVEFMENVALSDSRISSAAASTALVNDSEMKDKTATHEDEDKGSDAGAVRDEASSVLDDPNITSTAVHEASATIYSSLSVIQEEGSVSIVDAESSMDSEANKEKHGEENVPKKTKRLLKTRMVAPSVAEESDSVKTSVTQDDQSDGSVGSTGSSGSRKAPSAQHKSGSGSSGSSSEDSKKDADGSGGMFKEV